MCVYYDSVFCVRKWLLFLCYLGHGPFSHMFDALFIPAVRPDSDWKVNTYAAAVKKHFVN